MSRTADLYAEMMAQRAPEPEYQPCAVCGRESESPYTGDCHAADCARNAALDQRDPPEWAGMFERAA